MLEVPGIVTIVFDCQFYSKNKDSGHGVPVPFIVRLFDENGLRRIKTGHDGRGRRAFYKTESRTHRFAVPH